MSTTIDVLAPDEQAMLESFVSVVKQGQAVFMEVGNALMQIKERKLYRATHGTFEEFCRQEFGFSRTHAHRLCEAAEILEMLPVGNKPASERVIRPLSKLPDQEKAAAWADAVAASPTGKPTAKDVERVVKQRISTTKPTPKKFVCRNCYCTEQNDDGDCARCKEPSQPPKKKTMFDVSFATERLFDSLDAILAKWPEDWHADFYHACITYGNERKDA